MARNTFALRVSTRLSMAALISRITSDLNEDPQTNTKVEAINLCGSKAARGKDKPDTVRDTSAQVAKAKAKRETAVVALMKIMQDNPKALTQLKVLADLMNRANVPKHSGSAWTSESVRHYYQEALERLTSPAVSLLAPLA